MAPLAPSSLDVARHEVAKVWQRLLAALDAADHRIVSGPVAPPVTRALLKREIEKINLDLGCGEPAIDTVINLLEQATVHTSHPRYFGLFNPATILWGQVADLIAASLNPQLAVWSHAPAAVEMEQSALRFFATRLGLPNCGAFFTSGGEEANRCGVQVALVRTYPEVAELGLRALRREPVFYVSGESHLAWLKIATGLGLGRRAVRLVSVNDALQMDLGQLAELIRRDRREGRSPFMIGATAGTTAAGVIDPLPALADIAAQESLSLHVDAAWAGAAVLSDRWRGTLAGIERADSVTIDAHKWLSQPMGTGMFFARRAEILPEAFGVNASYMPPAIEGGLDYYQTTPQWSRPFRGLRLFLTLAVIGRGAYEQQINRDVAAGVFLRERLVARGWSLLNQTPLPVVCFTRIGHEADVTWHQQVVERVVKTGTAWLSSTLLDGRPALRACITSFRTSQLDIESLVEALHRAEA